MIKKTITYEDYNGNEVTEDFYFNLTKLEILEKDLEFGGIETTLARLTEVEDAKEAYELFKNLILATYGKRSEDGKRFIKSPELTEEFAQSPAMAELIIEFLQDPNAGAAFIEGTLPSKLIAEVKSAQENRGKEGGTETVELPTAPPVLEEKEPTDEELLKMDPKDMTPDQLRRAFILKTGAPQ